MKIISLSNALGSTFGITTLDLGIQIIVQMVGLAMKNWIGPTKEILTWVLKESKIEVLPKIEVTTGGTLIEVHTMEELTRTKIGAIKAIVDKTVE